MDPILLKPPWICPTLAGVARVGHFFYSNKIKNPSGAYQRGAYLARAYLEDSYLVLGYLVLRARLEFQGFT